MVHLRASSFGTGPFSILYRIVPPLRYKENHTLDVVKNDVVDSVFVLEVVLVLHNEGVLQSRMNLNLCQEVLIMKIIVFHSWLDLESFHCKDFLNQLEVQP
jgi:hypothetical protein